jgi:hypothetical protein
MGNPDPKTVSNATRVNEPDNREKNLEKQRRANTDANNNNDNGTSPETPLSDQPEEIARKAKEELQHEEAGRKKKVVEGGDKDVSHATIGKDEEKEAREENKDKKKSNNNHSKKK